ncbi:MAG: isoprenylcysteine carboxylmethyltransferase family protein [Bacillota bacterium]|nr:isoprenylcysteine carboxylmethyltransferase family protein [Bacillota bacterium]
MIQILFEKELPYKLLAFIVLVLFYGVYLGKQFLLRKKEIQCIEMGKRENMVERLMGIGTVGVLVAQLMSIFFGWNHSPADTRFTGFLIGMLGDFIFLASVICMKESWRVGIPEKGDTTLITTGIYSYSRNPAFLGFYLQYFGLLMMFGNFLIAGFTVFAMIMLHLQILQEEAYLKKTFGKEYEMYCQKVPGRYLCLGKGKKI